MEGALAWISELVQWVGRFVPRWVIVDTTKGAVKFVRGRRVQALGPGLWWYWPATTNLTIYPTARQAVDLRTQTIVTKDDRSIAAGALIVYEIVDIEAIVARTYDPEETVRDVALSAVHDVLCQYTWGELREGVRTGAVDTALRQEAQRGLRTYGVKVLKMTLTDLAPCRVLKLLTTQEPSVQSR